MFPDPQGLNNLTCTA